MAIELNHDVGRAPASLAVSSRVVGYTAMGLEGNSGIVIPLGTALSLSIENHGGWPVAAVLTFLDGQQLVLVLDKHADRAVILPAPAEAITLARLDVTDAGFILPVTANQWPPIGYERDPVLLAQGDTGCVVIVACSQPLSMSTSRRQNGGPQPSYLVDPSTDTELSIVGNALAVSVAGVIESELTDANGNQQGIVAAPLAVQQVNAAGHAPGTSVVLLPPTTLTAAASGAAVSALFSIAGYAYVEVMMRQSSGTGFCTLLVQKRTLDAGVVNLPWPNGQDRYTVVGSTDGMVLGIGPGRSMPVAVDGSLQLVMIASATSSNSAVVQAIGYY